MRLRRFLRFVLAAALSHAMSAGAQHAHVHGLGKLDAVVEGNSLTVRLEVPLDSLVGFERSPRTERERAAVRDMANTLRTGSDLVPSAGAHCNLKGVTLTSAVLPGELLDSQGIAATAADAGEGDDGHAELVAAYVFSCADPAQLRALEVRLFDSFKALKRLDTQVVTERTQAGGRLDSRARVLRW